ncbi:MAG: putative signal peptide peptidase SppA [Syntrophorhabdus sp. PtaU1.Bin050]|nr:MAG: putative signal peptide peptidase SppA [Syntrophorhabdus sp. PtaU1.Bin050]
MTRTKKAFLVIVILIMLTFGVSMLTGIFGKGMGGRIGIVEIEGVITDGRDAMEDIVRFKEDDSIRGVIVRINSPGGSVGPSQEIFQELKKLSAKKKVYVSASAVCASGGYYIASAGEKIYVNPSTITGSIGVIMEQMVVEDLLKKVGLQPNTMKAGKFKDVGSPFRKMQEEERVYFQQILDGIHDQFIQDVALGRKMPVDKVRQLSDGRIYTGTQAKELGLVDGIGTFYDAVDDMKKALNIKGKPVLVHGKRPFSFLKWLISSLADTIISRYDPSRVPDSYGFVPRY